MEPTNKRLIFVSCGQVTEEEKQLGTAVKNLIDSMEGFQAYFAEEVHDLTALGHHIFDALFRCSGAISFLQKRGSVTGISGEDWGVRSSVWVNQEIAILAFRKFLAADLGQISPGDHIEPFRFLATFTIRSNPGTAGG